MTSLVDFQLHLLPRSFYESLAETSAGREAPEELLSRALSASSLELPAADVGAELARWIDELERFGVEHAVLHASLSATVDEVAAAVALADGRCSALLVVDPLAEGAVENAARHLQERRFHGVLLYPGRHGYALDGPELAPLLHLLAERRAPAVVHCGLAEAPAPAPLRPSRRRGALPLDPLALAPVAREHPRVPFVVSDVGGGLLRETLLLGAECANVFVSTGAMERILATEPCRPAAADVFACLLGVFGPGRILFATGSCGFPRGWRRDVFTAQREALGACGLGERDRDRILGGNARRLLGLEGGARERP